MYQTSNRLPAKIAERAVLLSRIFTVIWSVASEDSENDYLLRYYGCLRETSQKT
jgi:hypothetical protein